MIINLYRIAPGTESTLGVLLTSNIQCFTCEDQYQAIKVDGETRIPAGTYEIKLRDAGGMNIKYKERYPNHKGMLWLQDVPGFEWVYIHIGNNDDHTEGCILVGYGCKINSLLGGGTISSSRKAYSDLYRQILKAIDSGEKVEIIIRDHLP